MKLIIKNGFIDLGSPIFMSNEKQQRFIEFMKETYKDVEVQNVVEKSRPGPHSGEQRKWTVDDIFILLQGGTIEEKAIILKRTEMSVIMRTGGVVPSITKWMKSKGYVVFPPPKEIITKFMDAEGML